VSIPHGCKAEQVSHGFGTPILYLHGGLKRIAETQVKFY